MKNAFLLASLLTLCFFSPLMAQGDKSQPVKGDPTESVENIKLAYAIAKYGYENESALSLIHAAEILLKYPQDPKWEIKLEESGEPVAQTKKTSIEIPLDPIQLLADAKGMANGDQSLLKLIDNTKAASSRGRLGGPGKTLERVEARTTDSYTIKFWGDELAEILVSGDGDTDLDLYVYDENGNLVAKDDDNTDDCYVRFLPKWTGPFTIKIKNIGNVYNQYIMVTN